MKLGIILFPILSSAFDQAMENVLIALIIAFKFYLPLKEWRSTVYYWWKICLVNETKSELLQLGQNNWKL